MTKKPGLASLLVPYRGHVLLLFFLSVVGNGASLFLPRLVGSGINHYAVSGGVPGDVAQTFAGVCVTILVCSCLQSLLQVYTAEKVALDLRRKLTHSIALQDHSFVVRMEPSRLLTNLTSDVDSVKVIVSEVFSGVLSALLVLGGASLMIFQLNWRLALAILSIVPLIGVAFALVLRRLRPIFRLTRQVIDGLNKVIQESVTGAAWIRVVAGAPSELERFAVRNGQALGYGSTIVRNFAALIPVVNMVAQSATVVILGLGGYFVIHGSMRIGDLATFYGYLTLMIFPIFVLGFMSGLISQASAAFDRIYEVLSTPPPQHQGNLEAELHGHVEARDLCLSYGEHQVLQNLSLSLKPGTRTAVLGPTAAGKTQMLYLLTGLLQPDSGAVLYDGRGLSEYHPDSLHRQVAVVFQDSLLFDLSIRENIAFSDSVSPVAWERALATAELKDFIDQLPEGPETRVSERGTRLSGGQKQRLMLARALAQQPAVLYLDDFTARVDPVTEARIFENLRRNYPSLTILTVTQRVSTIQDYEHIVLLMEGTVLAEGTHPQLLDSCPEYMQIYESQKSTQEYEVQS